jgi:hypothetical protein
MSQGGAAHTAAHTHTQPSKAQQSKGPVASMCWVVD